MKKKHPTIASHRGAAAWFAATLILTLTAGGCSRAGGPTVYEELLAVELSCEPAVARPGEAMIVEARLRNLTGRELAVRELNADSISFWIWSEEAPTQLRRWPVFSEREDLKLMAGLPAASALPRRFLFTGLTANQGNHYLLAIYQTPVQGERESPMVVSKPMPFRVEGSRAFARAEDGLITREEAFRVARERLGRPTAREDATLIRNEAGFYDWWVTLSVAPEALGADERPAKGFFVNPYMGVVRKEAQPKTEPPAIQ